MSTLSAGDRGVLRHGRVEGAGLRAAELAGLPVTLVESVFWFCVYIYTYIYIYIYMYTYIYIYNMYIYIYR